MKFYFYENGEKIGPFEADKLIGFAVEGRISPKTIIETESGKALPASKVKGLFFESPNALPPSPPIFSQRAESGNSPWKERVSAFSRHNWPVN